MTVINVKEVKSKIAYYEAQIRALKQLLDIASVLNSESSVSVGEVRRGRKPKEGKRKRGSVSDAIVALVENADQPLSSGYIRKALEQQGLAEKGSSTVYSILLQMSKRGAIIKTEEGYMPANSGGGIKSSKVRKSSSGRKPKAKPSVEETPEESAA